MVNSSCYVLNIDIAIMSDDSQLYIIFYCGFYNEKTTGVWQVVVDEATSTDIRTEKMYISLTCHNMSFSKQLYKPVEIDVEFILKSYRMQYKEEMCNFFLGCNVDLICVRKTTVAGRSSKSYILQNGIVTEVRPRFSKDARLFMKIYSPDYKLTLDKYSKAYTGKRFFLDVVKPNLEKFHVPFYAEENSTKHLQVLGYGDCEEVIQPYMVQYNESFYDFMARVAHRCGEFLYYENGQLHLGVPANVDGHSNLAPKTIDPLQVESVTYLDKSKGVVEAREFYKDTVSVEKFSANGADVPEFAYDSLLAHNWTMEKRMDDGGGPRGITTLSKRYQVKGKSLGVTLFSTVLKNKNLVSMVSQLISSTTTYLADAKMEYDYDKGVFKKDYVEKSLLWGTDTVNSRHKQQGDQDEAKKRTVLYEVNTNPAKLSGNGDVKSTNMFTNISEEGVKNTNIPRFLYFDAAFYHIIGDAANYCSAHTVEIKLGENYKEYYIGDIVRIGDDSTIYIVTSMRRTSTPVYYYEIPKTYTKVHNGVAERIAEGLVEKYELNTDYVVNYFIELVPLVTHTYVKSPYDDEENGTKYLKESNHILPPLREESDYRTSGVQRAFVAQNLDALRKGMVSIRYPWQKSTDDSSPWLRMTTMYSGKAMAGGVYFRPEIGAEVLVDYVGGNVEQPFVIGQLYNSVERHTGMAKDGCTTQAISSSNDHGIYFNDPDNTAEFMGGVLPFINTINSFKGVTKQSYAIDFKDKDKQLVGGITLKDKFGIYKIDMSSSNRNITISSPIGDVKIDAFTGITISAPNGNLTLEGKNISIKAGNKLTLQSGGFIDPKQYRIGGVPKKDGGKAVIEGVSDVVTKVGSKYFKMLDMDFIRTVWECIVKPLDGTLEISSNRFLTLKSGDFEGENIAYPETYGDYDLKAKADHDKDYANFARAVEDAKQSVEEYCLEVKLQTAKLRQSYESLENLLWTFWKPGKDLLNEEQIKGIQEEMFSLFVKGVNENKQENKANNEALLKSKEFKSEIK